MMLGARTRGWCGAGGFRALGLGVQGFIGFRGLGIGGFGSRGLGFCGG